MLQLLFQTNRRPQHRPVRAIIQRRSLRRRPGLLLKLFLRHQPSGQIRMVPLERVAASALAYLIGAELLDDVFQIGGAVCRPCVFLRCAKHPVVVRVESPKFADQPVRRVHALRAVFEAVPLRGGGLFV